MGLNAKLKTMRLLKENIRENLWNHGLGRDCLDITKNTIHRRKNFYILLYQN